MLSIYSYRRTVADYGVTHICERLATTKVLLYVRDSRDARHACCLKRSATVGARSASITFRAFSQHIRAAQYCVCTHALRLSKYAVNAPFKPQSDEALQLTLTASDTPYPFHTSSHRNHAIQHVPPLPEALLATRRRQLARFPT